LDVPFDLSAVMFIATANVVENLPPALLDRLEVIRFSGYTEAEKAKIAQTHLIPRQLEDCGLRNDEVGFSDDAVTTVIRDYTREAGLRNLEREIANVCRKIAYLNLQEGNHKRKVAVDRDMVLSILGREIPSRGS